MWVYYLYIAYSINSTFIYVGLGFFEVGGAIRTNKTFTTSMSRYKGPRAVIVALQRFRMKHQETAFAPQQELTACFAVPLQTGMAAVTAMWHTALLTSSLLFNMEALLSLCSILSTVLLSFGLQTKIQLKENSSLWYLLLCTPWLCLLSLQANSCYRSSLDRGCK